MQNEFDDHIKKQVNGFSLKPSPQIWERVKAQLPEKKRRRFAVWWWLPVIILLAGTGLYKLGRKHEQLKNNDALNKKAVIEKPIIIKKNDFKNDKVEINTSRINIKTNPLNNTKNKLADNNTIKKAASKPLKLIFTSNKQTSNNIIFNEENMIKSNYKKSIANNHLSTKKNYFKINKITQNNYLNGFDADKIISDSIKTNNGSTLDGNKIIVIKNSDSIVVADIKKDSINPKRDTVTIAIKKVIKGNKIPTIKWQLFATIGSSNTVGQAFGNGTNANYNYSSATSLGSSLPQSFASILAIPKAGISFTIGLQRTQQINQKLAWFGSIAYAYLSNHQASGAFVDSSLALGAGQPTLNSYYRYGNTTDHLNYIHRFNALAGLKYTLKPNASKPFSIYGGLLLGYQFSNKWLQADAKQPILFYSNSLTTKLITGTKIGFDWQLDKQFSVGTFYEYAFANASSSVTQNYLHWQMLGLKLSALLPFSKSKTIAHH